jgi:hypothetical protein
MSRDIRAPPHSKRVSCQPNRKFRGARSPRQSRNRSLPESNRRRRRRRCTTDRQVRAPIDPTPPLGRDVHDKLCSHKLFVHQLGTQQSKRRTGRSQHRLTDFSFETPDGCWGTRPVCLSREMTLRKLYAALRRSIGSTPERVREESHFDVAPNDLPLSHLSLIIAPRPRAPRHAI